MLGARSLHHSSRAAAGLETPRGHRRSTSTRQHPAGVRSSTGRYSTPGEGWTALVTAGLGPVENRHRRGGPNVGISQRRPVRTRLRSPAIAIDASRGEDDDGTGDRSTRRPPGGAAAHLTGSQVEALRSLLADVLVEHRWKTEALAGLAAALGPLDDPAGHQREAARAGAARALDAVSEVERALARLADGTLGVCEGCGGPIPFERLEAIPEALCCVACVTAGHL